MKTVAGTIECSVQVSASPADALAAVTTPPGIAGWWAVNSEVGAGAGATATMTFHKDGATIPMAFEITESTPERVSWRCTDNGNPTWIGTTMTWSFSSAEGGAQIDFEHAGWGEDGPGPEIAKGWDHFINTSLKNYLDGGQGMPWE